MRHGISAHSNPHLQYAEIDFTLKHLADFLLFHRVVISVMKLILYVSEYFKMIALLGSSGRIFICHNLICKTVASRNDIDASLKKIFWQLHLALLHLS